ncbi:hypothetical protein VaNZ11_004869 [Volvox africanus]|uniref:Uncharacterized protein n=1 Tax=Volvox africanus TaxID=51714 RepID=A0ABQ5RYI0_9CHLO|nr:hypothetical protein VaNZ11_004869 [Volvox africanus]
MATYNALSSFPNCPSLNVNFRIHLQRRCACGALLCSPWRPDANSAPHHLTGLHDRHPILPFYPGELPKQSRHNRAYPPATSAVSKSSQVQTSNARDGSSPNLPQQQRRQAGPFQSLSSLPPHLNQMQQRQKQLHQQDEQKLQQQKRKHEKQQQQRLPSGAAQNPRRRQQLGSSQVAGSQDHMVGGVGWRGDRQEGPGDRGVANWVGPADGDGGSVGVGGGGNGIWIADGKGREGGSGRGKGRNDRAFGGEGSAAELLSPTSDADNPSEATTELLAQLEEPKPLLLPSLLGQPSPPLPSLPPSPPPPPLLPSVPPEPSLQWQLRQQKRQRSRRPLRSRRLMPYIGDATFVHSLSDDASSAPYKNEDADGVEEGLMELLWSADRRQSVDEIFRDGAAMADGDGTAGAAAVNPPWTPAARIAAVPAGTSGKAKATDKAAAAGGGTRLASPATIDPTQVLRRAGGYFQHKAQLLAPLFQRRLEKNPVTLARLEGMSESYTNDAALAAAAQLPPSVTASASASRGQDSGTAVGSYRYGIGAQGQIIDLVRQARSRAATEVPDRVRRRILAAGEALAGNKTPSRRQLPTETEAETVGEEDNEPGIVGGLEQNDLEGLLGGVELGFGDDDGNSVSEEGRRRDLDLDLDFELDIEDPDFHTAEVKVIRDLARLVGVAPGSVAARAAAVSGMQVAGRAAAAAVAVGPADDAVGLRRRRRQNDDEEEEDAKALFLKAMEAYDDDDDDDGDDNDDLDIDGEDDEDDDGSGLAEAEKDEDEDEDEALGKPLKNDSPLEVGGLGEEEEQEEEEAEGEMGVMYGSRDSGVESKGIGKEDYRTDSYDNEDIYDGDDDDDDYDDDSQVEALLDDLLSFGGQQAEAPLAAPAAAVPSGIPARDGGVVANDAPTESGFKERLNSGGSGTSSSNSSVNWLADGDTPLPPAAAATTNMLAARSAAISVFRVRGPGSAARARGSGGGEKSPSASAAAAAAVPLSSPPVYGAVKLSTSTTRKGQQRPPPQRAAQLQGKGGYLGPLPSDDWRLYDISSSLVKGTRTAGSSSSGTATEADFTDGGGTTDFPAAAPRPPRLVLKAFLYCIGRDEVYDALWRTDLIDRLEFVTRMRDADLVLHRSPGLGERQFALEDLRIGAKRARIPFVSVREASEQELVSALERALRRFDEMCDKVILESE